MMADLHPAWQIAVALGSIAALLLGMVAIKRLAAAFAWPPESQRKLVHIATGLYTLSLPFLFPNGWPVYMLVGCALAVLAVLRIPWVARDGIGSTLHSVSRQSYGDIFLILSVGVTFFLAQGEWVLYLLPMAVLTLADAAAAMAGTVYGRRFFAVEEGRKSWEGTAIFFGVTLIIAMIALLVLTDVGRVEVIALALAVAAIGTLIEAESWRGLDNFFLPVGLLLYLYASLDATLLDLGIELLALAGLLLLFHALGKGLGLRPHTIRVYVITIFLILTVTRIEHAVLPLLALAAQAWASRDAPPPERYPHLDMAATVAFLSIGWLSLGTATNLNALMFWQASMVGLAVGMAVLAVRGKPEGPGWIWPVLAMAALVAPYEVVIESALAWEVWSGAEWPMLAGVMVLCLVVPLLAPGWFARGRTAKVAVIAVAVPLPFYAVLWQIMGQG